MLALIIHITRDGDNEGGFIIRSDNLPNEDGPEGEATVPFERRAADKAELRERVGDMAWTAVANFEAEEARRQQAHEEHVAEHGEDATEEQEMSTEALAAPEEAD